MTTESRPLRPEEDLLLCCARTRVDAERAERISTLLVREIDWPYLLRLAHPHGVLPLLYRHLERLGGDRVPGVILDQLRERFVRNARSNLRLTGELLRLLQRFESHGISLVPLKGPVLAAALYGDLSLRPFRDLDLLVRKQDVASAKALLLADGYRLPLQMNRAQEAAYLRSACEFLFERDAGRTLVELHWGITPEYFSCWLDIERWWQRLEPASLAGRPVLSLNREDLLLFLCVHGAKHGWERLEWICDVAELVRRHPEVKWARVLGQAASVGAGRMLLLGLKLAGDLLGAHLPRSLRQRVESDPALESLAVQVCERLCREYSGPPGIFEGASFHVRAKERVRDRARYVVLLGATPSIGDWAMLPLPALLFFLYYLLRPIRLLGKYGGRAAARLLRSGLGRARLRLMPTADPINATTR